MMVLDHGRILESTTNNMTEATSTFAPLWRRKWLILAVGILVAVGTYYYYKHKTPVYLSSTQVYLGSGSEEQGVLAGGGKKKSGLEPGAQAEIINSPLVHEVVVRRLRAQHTAIARQALRGKVHAKASEKNQFMSISAEARAPRAAALLANLTAQVYVKRENGNYTRGIAAAIALARAQLSRVEAALNRPKQKGVKGSGGLTTAATLQVATQTSKINQLETELSIVKVKQIGVAKPTGSQLLSPMPKKNAIFGFVLGLFLAALAAYAVSRLDRRLRSLAAVEAAFQTHLLSALPSVRRPILRRDGRLSASKPLAEPLRRLYTSLQLAGTAGHSPNGSARSIDDRGVSPRSILFLSADAADGKSTIVAALALVQRDAGRRAAVVEADFRRPVQAKLLDVSGHQGLAEALSGTLELDEAMQPADSAPGEPSAHSPGSAASPSTVLQSQETGAVSVLVGRNADDSPGLMVDHRMADLLDSLTGEFDNVLIDAPSPLEVSDVLPLLSMVDGVVLVARVGHTRERSAQRLVQLLARTPCAPILGVVANDVPRADLERYGFVASHGARRWLSGR
ncbi:MAG: Wzz/FepE/Etk N-terminal domain-containing protein [Solirubrobacteraceae bacterium]